MPFGKRTREGGGFMTVPECRESTGEDCLKNAAAVASAPHDACTGENASGERGSARPSVKRGRMSRHSRTLVAACAVVAAVLVFSAAPVLAYFQANSFKQNFVSYQKVEPVTYTSFAVYSADDGSLNFYHRPDTEMPAAGDTFESKTATAVYTDLCGYNSYGTYKAP